MKTTILSKWISVLGVIVLFVTLQSSGCKKDESTSENLVIGTPGPAGGIIFYDKGYYSEGWRYLEAAPFDLPGLYKFGCVIPSQLDLPHEIGYGRSNTGQIDTDQSNIYASSSTNCNISQVNSAPKVCYNYSFNGYDDWFLPSHYEFKMMAQNLGVERNNIGNLYLNSYYWASSEDKWETISWGVSTWHYAISRPKAIWGNSNQGSWDNWVTENPEEELRVRPIRAY